MDNVVTERNARHSSQMYRSADLSLCDEPRSGWPLVLNDEALEAAMEEDNSQNCTAAGRGRI